MFDFDRAGGFFSNVGDAVGDVADRVEDVGGDIVRITDTAEDVFGGGPTAPVPSTPGYTGRQTGGFRDPTPEDDQQSAPPESAGGTGGLAVGLPTLALVAVGAYLVTQ